MQGRGNIRPAASGDSSPIHGNSRIQVNGRRSSDPSGSGGGTLFSIEQAIVTRARNGDPAAFRMIFDRNVTSVRRFLVDLLRNPAAADEATQETFVRAIATPPADLTRPKAWLETVLRNLATSLHRRHAPENLDALEELLRDGAE